MGYVKRLGFWHKIGFRAKTGEIVTGCGVTYPNYGNVISDTPDNMTCRRDGCK